MIFLKDRAEFRDSKTYGSGGPKSNPGLKRENWATGGLPAAYFAIEAFSETDTTEDLKKIDVRTLILHGDADKIVPIGNAYRSAKLIANATLKEYSGAPHAIIATAKNEINDDLLAFIHSG